MSSRPSLASARLYLTRSRIEDLARGSRPPASTDEVRELASRILSAELATRRQGDALTRAHQHIRGVRRALSKLSYTLDGFDTANPEAVALSIRQIVDASASALPDVELSA